MFHTNPKRSERVVIQVTPEELKALNAKAAKMDLSRTDVVRAAIAQFFGKS